MVWVGELERESVEGRKTYREGNGERERERKREPETE